MNTFKYLTISLMVVLLSLATVNCMAQGKGQQKKDSPFLITGKMPHMTKMLMQQWDNAALYLTDAQKSKLLVIRKQTISGAQGLGKKIAPLENQVAKAISSGKTPEELQSLVQEIAKLKAEATMIHLRCLYNTSAILDQNQLELLKTL